MNPNCDTANIERIGVNAISLFFEKIGWSFRERPHSDFGIDADVEQKINGKRTNRHIALQIKSGESYVKIKKNGKITFSIDPWHYSYWLQSDRPVLILLYDPDTEKIYWEQVRLATLQQSPKYKKIEIDALKFLDEDSIDEFNDIIETYVMHNIYNVDKEFVTYEYSMACVEEYSKSVKDLVEQLVNFRNKLQSHFINPHSKTLCLQLDVLGMDIKKHIEADYALLHKACWYLAFLANIINIRERPLLVKILDDYINNLTFQKASWLTVIDNFKKLFHPDIPKSVQRSNAKVIRYVEDYAALINLSLEDFVACKIVNKNQI